MSPPLGSPPASSRRIVIYDRETSRRMIEKMIEESKTKEFLDGALTREASLLSPRVEVLCRCEELLMGD